VKMFDADKTRMTGLRYGEKTDNMLRRFHPIPERYRRTDIHNSYKPISRVSMLMRDKNESLPFMMTLFPI